jgi:hypothetical protein
MADFADTKAVAQKADITGTATAASASNLVAVSVSGTVITCNVVRGLTVASGDVVLIARTGAKWWVKNVLYAAAPPAGPDGSDVAPPPKPVTVTGTLVVAPVETRSYRNSVYVGWRTDNDDVYQGSYGSGNHIGCAFYGDKPRSIRGSTVTRATLRVKRVSAGDYGAKTSTLFRITNKRKPGGSPTFYGGSTNGPRLAVNKTDTSFDVPTSWAQDLVDGNAGGLAIYDSSGSPYMRFAGRSSYSSAWTLTIKWKRTS